MQWTLMMMRRLHPRTVGSLKQMLLLSRLDTSPYVRRACERAHAPHKKLMHHARVLHYFRAQVFARARSAYLFRYAMVANLFGCAL